MSPCLMEAICTKETEEVGPDGSQGGRIRGTGSLLLPRLEGKEE